MSNVVYRIIIVLKSVASCSIASHITGNRLRFFCVSFFFILLILLRMFDIALSFTKS